MKFSQACRQKCRKLSHTAAVLLVTAATAGPAQALEFDVFGTELKIDSLLTAGILVRTEERDPSLIAKSNLEPGICVRRLNPTFVPTRGGNEFSGDTCTTSVLASNTAYVNKPGSYNINGDNGNLNFDQFSLANAAIKLTSDITFSIADFNFFLRPIGIFDGVYANLVETHPDTTLQAAETDFPDVNKRRLGFKPGLLDYSVGTNFNLAGLDVSVKVGNQVLNWGESAFLALNSLNTVNAPDSSRLRVPGFDVKELFQPQGMALIGFDVIENVHADMYLQYQWKPAIVDPAGSFFSVSDTLGEGGRYAMLSFGKAPEDPENLYRAVDNAGTPPPSPIPGGTAGDPLRTLGSEQGRTVYRDPLEEEKRRPDEYSFDQFGMAVKAFLPDFNNGTEVSFYAAQYHSRIPSVSLISSMEGCIPDDTGTPATNLAALVASCQTIPTVGSGQPFLPVDTAKLVVEYPKNVYMFGTSFNTTVGDFALSGEYVFRPNMPIQIHTVDLTLAAVGPAFPNDDYNLGVAALPNHRSAAPDFVSVYRGVRNRPGRPDLYGYGPNEYIRGFERLKVGQAGLTLLKTVGGDNFINASQITLLLETGLTHVVDMPDIGEIQFQGAETNTHISHGGDGTGGISPSDLSEKNKTPDDGQTCASTATPKASAEMVNPRCLRQNPTAQRAEDFGSELSYGYRAIFLPRFDSLIFGANVETLFGFFHDVSGVAPGLGQNFVGGRRQMLVGVRFDYLSRFIGEIRHTWNFGTTRDSLRDRDNLLFTLGYQF